MARNFIPLVPSGTINADASVAQLEQDVLAMDSKVGELAEDIGDTEQEINQLKSQITASVNGIYNGIKTISDVTVNVGAAVNKSTGEVTQFPQYTTWAASELYTIPDGTKKIESNFNMGVGFTTTFGFAIYDSSNTFVVGGQDLSAITIQDNYKYIRMTNYNADSDHSGLYVSFVLDVSLNDNQNRLDALSPYSVIDNSIPNLTLLANHQVQTSDGVIVALQYWFTWYFPVKKGQTLTANVKTVNATDHIFAFSTELPEVNVKTGVNAVRNNVNESNINVLFETDGYFIICMPTTPTVTGTLQYSANLSETIETISSNVFAETLYENLPLIYGTAINKSSGVMNSFAETLTTWVTTPFITIPADTSAIESNFDASGGSAIMGCAVYDETFTYVTGAADPALINPIPTNAKYIRLTDYDADSDHSGIYVKFYVPVNAMAGKTCFCFGDSVTWYDLNPYTWGKENGKPAIGYETWMRRILGLATTNKGISGAEVTQICDSLKSTNLTGVDFLTLTSGANDERHNTTLGAVLEAGSTFDTTTFCGAIQSAIEYALAQNPEMKIILCTPIQGWIYENGYDETDYPSHPDGGDIDPKWANAIKRIAEIYALPVCDWYTESGLNWINHDMYYNDPEPPTNDLYSLHPSAKGYKRMSEILIDTFKKVMPLS